jgi:hypothetical protein
MVISIQLGNRTVNSGQVSKRARRTRAKGTTVMSRRSLFLAALIVVLAALLAVQVAGVGTGADVAPGQVEAAEVSTGDSSLVGNQFPSAQDWVDTSPYAHEPISISGGAPGINMPR